MAPEYQEIMREFLDHIFDPFSQERSDARTIPIIAMTANAFDEDARHCLEAGMNAHLSKPLQMDKVIATIAKFCGASK